MIKQKIQSSFDVASDTYDTVAHIQKESAYILVKNLHNTISTFYLKTILDLGTGTGYIPEILLSYYPYASFMLNDIAPKMINKVQQKFNKTSNISFYIGDMESIQIKPYDLIISNFAFQWIEKLETMLKKLYNNSKVLAFSCLLDGTFKEWKQILQSYNIPSPLKQYPQQPVLYKCISALGSTTHYLETKCFQLPFTGARSFVNYLKHLGAAVSNKPLPTQKVKNLITNYNESFHVTYNVFFGIMERK